MEISLSAAIRRGCELRPEQNFGDFFGEKRTGFLGLFGPKVQTSCAWGAAQEGGNVRQHNEIAATDSVGYRGGKTSAGQMITVLEVPYDWIPVLKSFAGCPECGHQFRTEHMIPHLNDKHRWSRESIAVWIEGIERLVEQPEEGWPKRI